MSLAPQLLVFPSRMFLASQYIHKCHFQISFLQRKVSQPGKLKKVWYIFQAVFQCYSPALLMQHEGWKMSLICLPTASPQLIKIFLLVQTPPPHIAGACETTTTTPSAIMPFHLLTEAQQPVLNNTQCKCPVFLFEIITSKLRTGKSRDAIFFFCWLFTLRGPAEQ